MHDSLRTSFRCIFFHLNDLRLRVSGRLCISMNLRFRFRLRRFVMLKKVVSGSIAEIYFLRRDDGMISEGKRVWIKGLIIEDREFSILERLSSRHVC